MSAVTGLAECRSRAVGLLAAEASLLHVGLTVSKMGAITHSRLAVPNSRSEQRFSLRKE